MKKQLTIGMMTIMMVFGTTTSSFGKSHNQQYNEMARKEVRVNHKSDKHMNKCHDCGKTITIVKNHRCPKPAPRPVPRPMPQPRHVVVHHTSNASTGAVVGAVVVGAILGSLLK